MDRIATGSATDRRDLFSETASRLGMNPAIVEKDFWVCWILKHLFAEPALKGQMVFKGGTSLSKVFGLIDRFSEDIGADPRLAAAWVRPCGRQRSLSSHHIEDKAESLQPGDEREGCQLHPRDPARSIEPALCSGFGRCRQYRRRRSAHRERVLATRAPPQDSSTA